MSEHTQGTMKPGVSKVFGSNAFTAVPEGNESKIVAVFGFCGAPDEAESIANAKRFCAVWNACEQIQDPENVVPQLLKANELILECTPEAWGFDFDEEAAASMRWINQQIKRDATRHIAEMKAQWAQSTEGVAA